MRGIAGAPLLFVYVITDAGIVALGNAAVTDVAASIHHFSADTANINDLGLAYNVIIAVVAVATVTVVDTTIDAVIDTVSTALAFFTLFLLQLLSLLLPLPYTSSVSFQRSIRIYRKLFLCKTSSIITFWDY